MAEVIINDSEDVKTCSICLEEITVEDISYLPCCHGFHQDCFNEYITQKIKSKRNISCPICRIDHFVYGQRNYQFIMNELGITYENEDEDNRIPSYMTTGVHNSIRTHNTIPIQYIPHSVITMSLNNNLHRTPNRRHQHITCNAIWFRYRYYLIGCLLIIVLSYVSFLLITTFKNR